MLDQDVRSEFHYFSTSSFHNLTVTFYEFVVDVDVNINAVVGLLGLVFVCIEILLQFQIEQFLKVCILKCNADCNKSDGMGLMYLI